MHPSIAISTSYATSAVAHIVGSFILKKIVVNYLLVHEYFNKIIVAV
jgi:hypothetical protein